MEVSRKQIYYIIKRLLQINAVLRMHDVYIHKAELKDAVTLCIENYMSMPALEPTKKIELSNMRKFYENVEKLNDNGSIPEYNNYQPLTMRHIALQRQTRNDVFVYWST